MPRVNRKEAALIRRLHESSGNVLGWEVRGEVTEEEVRTVSEEFRAAVAEHGKVRPLVRMRRIPRMGLGAWVEAFKLTPYARDVERYAIVSDSALFEWAAKIGDAFIGGEVKRFEDSRYEEALAPVLTSKPLPELLGAPYSPECVEVSVLGSPQSPGPVRMSVPG